jgi:hypothetical protein
MSFLRPDWHSKRLEKSAWMWKKGRKCRQSIKRGTGQAPIYGLQALRNAGVTKVSQFGTGKVQKHKVFVDQKLCSIYILLVYLAING